MNSTNPLYMPYGAYEMKATYQRNMLIGLLITTSFVMTILLTSWLLSRGEELIVPNVLEKPIGPMIVVTIPPPESFVVQRAPLDPAFAPTQMGDKILPVPDEELGDLDMVIATIEERAMIINERIAPDDGRGVTEYGVIEEPIDYVPPTDSFVAMEIYPEMIHHVTPDYPRFAREAGLEGVVHVHALVMPDGSVKDALVFKTSDVKSLDEAALSVAKHNVFKPGVQNGRPVACWVVYKVVFELSQ